MFPAAQRLTACALALLASVATSAADAAVRTTPSRPASSAASPSSRSPVATKKFGAIEYVSASDVAARLGLKLTWLERGRKLTLTGAGVRAELENDTRDITVNGLRVFLGDPIIDAGGQLYVSEIDFERCLAPMLRPGHGVAALAAPKTIVLDPGHGGHDPGTSANEKVYALDVAKRAEKLLERAGYRVVLTRSKDTYVGLAERATFARANKADLFVSIHFNAVANDTKTSGVEVYTFPPQFQRSTGSWGLKDNAEDDDAPVNRFDHWNVALAHAIHRRFISEMKVVDRGKKLMHLGVLRSLNCPGVLIECGFLTSTEEARKIATAAHRQKLAAAIAAGIRDYAATVEAARAKSAVAASGSK